MVRGGGAQFFGLGERGGICRLKHPGVRCAKYDTLGARLLKCPAGKVGVKSAKVGHPVCQTAKPLKKRSGTPGNFVLF